MNIQDDLDFLTENNNMTVGLYSNFINVLTHCTCPFVYQTSKLKHYSLYRLIVHSNKIHFSFEPINLTQVYRQNTSLTKVLET